MAAITFLTGQGAPVKKQVGFPHFPQFSSHIPLTLCAWPGCHGQIGSCPASLRKELELGEGQQRAQVERVQFCADGFHAGICCSPGLLWSLPSLRANVLWATWQGPCLSLKNHCVIATSGSNGASFRQHQAMAPADLLKARGEGGGRYLQMMEQTCSRPSRACSTLAERPAPTQVDLWPK